MFWELLNSHSVVAWQMKPGTKWWVIQKLPCFRAGLQFLAGETFLFSKSIVVPAFSRRAGFKSSSALGTNKIFGI